MFKFSINEYIKNIVYNIISVLLLTGTFVACTIFTSNISAQTRINRFFEPYFDENSIVTGRLDYYFDENKTDLIKLQGVLKSQEMNVGSDDVDDLRNCLIYDEYVMDNLTPRLKEGKIVTDGSGDCINVLISENNSGIGVGDEIHVRFTTDEGYAKAALLNLTVKVSGVIESGQKLFYGKGVCISHDMTLKDLMGTYHYEQLGESIMIIPEKELDKIPGKLYIESWRYVFKFQDDITEEERLENYRILLEEEGKIPGNLGSMMASIPEISAFVEMQEQETLDIIITNVPMCITIAVLVMICIICMISIRNAYSMKYYATLYICGMPIRSAVIFTGIEMVINSVLSIVLSVSVIKIQMSNEIFGEINCMLNIEQVAIMMGISLVMVISATLTTLKTLKERSPMSVLRDTAY